MNNDYEIRLKKDTKMGEKYNKILDDLLSFNCLEGNHKLVIILYILLALSTPTLPILLSKASKCCTICCAIFYGIILLLILGIWNYHINYLPYTFLEDLARKKYQNTVNKLSQEEKDMLKSEIERVEQADEKKPKFLYILFTITSAGLLRDSFLDGLTLESILGWSFCIYVAWIGIDLLLIFIDKRKMTRQAIYYLLTTA